MLLTFSKCPLFLYSLVFVLARFFFCFVCFSFLSSFSSSSSSSSFSLASRATVADCHCRCQKNIKKKLPFLSLFMLQSHVLWRLLRLSLSLSLFQDNKTSHWLLYFIHATFFNSPKQQQTRFKKNVSACQAFPKRTLVQSGTAEQWSPRCIAELCVSRFDSGLKDHK